jgi:hypothetical protein
LVQRESNVAKLIRQPFENVIQFAAAGGGV